MYRAVDKAGRTINFFLSVRWDHHAAQRFLAKGIRRNGVPERITIDKSEANTEQDMNWKEHQATWLLDPWFGRCISSFGQHLHWSSAS